MSLGGLVVFRVVGELAVPKAQAPPFGRYGNAQAAAATLVQACGKPPGTQAD